MCGILGKPFLKGLSYSLGGKGNANIHQAFYRIIYKSKSRGKMIVNPEWLKPKEKPYFHQISMDCLEKLVDCIGRFNKGEIDV